jgi:hypothetical protein
VTDAHQRGGFTASDLGAERAPHHAEATVVPGKTQQQFTCRDGSGATGASNGEGNVAWVCSGHCLISVISQKKTLSESRYQWFDWNQARTGFGMKKAAMRSWRPCFM